MWTRRRFWGRQTERLASKEVRRRPSCMWVGGSSVHDEGDKEPRHEWLLPPVALRRWSGVSHVVLSRARAGSQRLTPGSPCDAVPDQRSPFANFWWTWC